MNCSRVTYTATWINNRQIFCLSFYFFLFYYWFIYFFFSAAFFRVFTVAICLARFLFNRVDSSFWMGRHRSLRWWPAFSSLVVFFQVSLSGFNGFDAWFRWIPRWINCISLEFNAESTLLLRPSADDDLVDISLVFVVVRGRETSVKRRSSWTILSPTVVTWSPSVTTFDLRELKSLWGRSINPPFYAIFSAKNDTSTAFYLPPRRVSFLTKTHSASLIK